MKKLLISLIGIIIIGGLSWGIYTAVNNSKTAKVSSSLDTSLDSFRTAEGIALFYLDYLAMRDDSDYQSLKKLMSGKMSGDLFVEYFGLDKYEIHNKTTEVDLESVGGHTFGKNHYEFKIDFTISGGGSSKGMVLYIEVKNNIVTSIVSYNTY